MNTFEKKLAQFHEEQERKSKKPMNRHHRTELIDQLRAQLKTETDPDRRLRITSQLTKLIMKKDKRGKRKPKSEAAPSTKTRFLREIYTGSLFDVMSDGELLSHHLVLQIEKKCRGRGGWDALTREEKDALLAEATANLSAE